MNIKFEKINDLCDQVFDYLHLTYYDLESKINNELNMNTIKSKFETFADKHFKSAIKEFEKFIASRGATPQPSNIDGKINTSDL